MVIEVYADTASPSEMLESAKNPVVKGFTTNPSLARKAGVTDYLSWAKSLCEALPSYPLSLEVIADHYDDMERQAAILSELGENVYVKIPITLTGGTPAIELIQRLWRQNIKVNITAVMTEQQIRWIGNAHGIGRRPTIISIFAGRMADAGHNPIFLKYIAERAFGHVKNTKYLWASTRELLNVKQAEEAGFDIITLSPDLLKKLPLIGKDLAEYSRETVQQFYDDAKAAGYSF